MAVDTGANALPVFDLKSASLTLVALLLKTTDIAVLAEELDHRFGDSPDLFDGDPVVIDLSPVADATEAIDFDALVALLRERRMLPVAVKGGSAAQAEAARAAGTVAALHFKVDTGLTRLGAPLAEAADRFRAIAALPGVRLDGVFTHLARGDESDLATTEEQLDRFDSFLDAIEPPRWVHASATGGIASLAPRARVTAVRPGLALYGLDAAPHLAERLALRPALAWRSRVHRVADVPKGTGVSYGHEYRLPRDGRIATVPVGYGDGLSRLARAARLLVRGTPLPIAGRVAMDHVMLDVTDVGDVQVLVDVHDAAGVERRRAADDAVDLVALLEQKLGEVRTVLAGDAGDQRLSHRWKNSFTAPAT